MPARYPKEQMHRIKYTKLTPEQIDYLNLHGTATRKNDEVEATVIRNLFPATTFGSSTKGWTGHTLGAAGIIEFFGGLLVMVGLVTAIAAFIASGEMAFAYFLVHFPQGGWPIQNNGQLAVLFCFIFLYIAARGSGMLSLDSVLFARTPARIRVAGT